MPLRLRQHIGIPPHHPSAFDHGDVELSTGRVFVAHTAAGTVEVLDGERGEHVATIPEFPEASGLLCVQRDGVVFAAARANGRVLLIDSRSLDVTRVLEAGSKPNGLAWDARQKHLLVADVEDNRARIIDPKHGRLLAAVDFPGRPRWCVFDDPRNRFLVNIREPACVVAVDAERLALAHQIPIASAGPHGLDLDTKRNKAFVACDGGEVVALDLLEDEMIGSVPIAGVPDAIWFNAERQRLYVAIGDPGVIDVIDTETMRVEEGVQTERGAHTTAFDSRRQLLYVFLPSSCSAAVYAV